MKRAIAMAMLALLIISARGAGALSLCLVGTQTRRGYMRTMKHAR